MENLTTYSIYTSKMHMDFFNAKICLFLYILIALKNLPAKRISLKTQSKTLTHFRQLTYNWSIHWM